MAESIRLRLRINVAPSMCNVWKAEAGNKHNCAAGCWIMRRRWLPLVSGGKRLDSDAASNVAPLAAVRLLRLTPVLRSHRRRPRPHALDSIGLNLRAVAANRKTWRP